MVRFMTLVAVVLTCTAVAATVALKPYPGARVDEKASQTATTMLKSLGEKKASMLKATVYMTAAAYDSVTAYYLARGKETHPPSTKPDDLKRLPSGETIREMYVIFDGKKDIIASNAWAHIQRPFVGSMAMVGGKVLMDDIRDVTVITVVSEK
jgi:hypothetical protein